MKHNQEKRLTGVVHRVEKWTFAGLWIIWFVMYSIGAAKDETSSPTEIRQRACQLQSPVPTRIDLADTIKHVPGTVDRSTMIKVPAGSFMMGGDVDKPLHVVTLSEFYIDKYEVTVAEYRKFCAATHRSMPHAPRWGWKDDNPIVGVTWKDAADYAEWVGKRLPTEAEWEYAARGGTAGRGFKYSGSTDIGEVAWYSKNGGKMTHPVGTKAPNELGIFDMSGNAGEWCADYYSGSYYSRSPKLNPLGPRRGSDRVVRGGSFLGDEYDCQVSFRRSALPDRTSSRFGFRCVWSSKKLN